MYDWHFVHFLNELERADHTVTDCNPVARLGYTANKADYSSILVDCAKQVLQQPGPHMLLAASGTDDNLEPGAIDYIRSLGIPCVNFSVDDVVAPHRFRVIGSHFDLHWTTFLGTDKLLRQYGCNVLYLPMAANPFYFNNKGGTRAHTIGFVGSRYGARTRYIQQLAEAGVPLKVRGRGWTSSSSGILAQTRNRKGIASDTVKALISLMQHRVGRKIIIGGLVAKVKQQLGLSSKNTLNGTSLHKLDLGDAVSLDGTVQLYSTCTASLGVLEVANTFELKHPVFQYRLREFEATMIGCAHIVRRVPELEQSFSEDKEIIFYDSIEECVDKARYYLSDEGDNICRQIGANARRRSEQEHTWTCRFTEIWKALGI